MVRTNETRAWVTWQVKANGKARAEQFCSNQAVRRCECTQWGYGRSIVATICSIIWVINCRLCDTNLRETSHSTNRYVQYNMSICVYTCHTAPPSLVYSIKPVHLLTHPMDLYSILLQYIYIYCYPQLLPVAGSIALYAPGNTKCKAKSKPYSPLEEALHRYILVPVLSII